MENKNKIIKQNEKKINELLKDKESVLSDLGRLLIKNKLSFPGYEQTVSQFNELTIEIKNIRSEIDKINQYKKRVDSITTEEKTALKKIKDIKAENEKHFIGIGETVFSIYLERPGELYDLEDSLKDMLELKEKIEDISDRIENRERKKETENFIGKIIVSSTGTVLESKKKLLESRYVSLYKATGKKLCDEKYFETVSDKEIQGIFSAFIGNQKVIEDYEIKLDSLKAEKANYLSETEEKEKKLKSEYHGKPEEAAEDKDTELNLILLAAGSDFYKKYKEELPADSEYDSELMKCIGKVEEAEGRTAALIFETDKLKNEIEIENKQEEIKKINETVLSRQEKIKSIKKEIDKMNRTVKKLEKEIEKLI